MTDVTDPADAEPRHCPLCGAEIPQGCGIASYSGERICHDCWCKALDGWEDEE